jgi:hypothetical protein
MESESSVVNSFCVFSTVTGSAERLDIGNVVGPTMNKRNNMIGSQSNLWFNTTTRQTAITVMALEVRPFLRCKRPAIRQFARAAALGLGGNFFGICLFPFAVYFSIVVFFCLITAPDGLTGFFASPVCLYLLDMVQSMAAVGFLSSLRVALFIRVFALPSNSLFEAFFPVGIIIRAAAFIATQFTLRTQAVFPFPFPVKFAHWLNSLAFCTTLGLHFDLLKTGPPCLRVCELVEGRTGMRKQSGVCPQTKIPMQLAFDSGYCNRK